MTLLVTEAIVLHVFDYLESSRIFRLVTREAGVRSALARGARRSTRRFGSALDLFAQGTAQLHIKPGRDLDTLGAFDVERARPELAADLARFTGAVGSPPATDACSESHAPIAPNDSVLFIHPAGGALCGRCARLAAAGRRL